MLLPQGALLQLINIRTILGAEGGVANHVIKLRVHNVDVNQFILSISYGIESKYQRLSGLQRPVLIVSPKEHIFRLEITRKKACIFNQFFSQVFSVTPFLQVPFCCELSDKTCSRKHLPSLNVDSPEQCSSMLRKVVVERTDRDRCVRSSAIPRCIVGFPTREAAPRRSIPVPDNYLNLYQLHVIVVQNARFFFQGPIVLGRVTPTVWRKAVLK
mmetsp:Transcript_2944/g.7197  ORF Transcript_2944/g.7197 Transcript_2944/m.7197 type:complete len:214 (+) Transcript_2944:601-1242(+)